MNLNKRVDAIEARNPSQIYRAHRVMQEAGQSRDEAISAYARQTSIDPADCIVFRVIYDPQPRP